MKLFSKEETNKKRKDQNRDLLLKNERLISSLKKVLKLQNEIDFDTEKARKVKDYEVWCKDIQTKQSKELETLNGYSKLVEDKKEEFYSWVSKIDCLEDKVISLNEEIEKLSLQVKWNEALV